MKVTTSIFLGLAFVFPVGAAAQTPTPDATPGGITNETADSSRVRREQAYAKLLGRAAERVDIAQAPDTSRQDECDETCKNGISKGGRARSGTFRGLRRLFRIGGGNGPDRCRRIDPSGVDRRIKIAPLNFGGHRMLARLYTVKSRLNNGTLDADMAAKAIDQWKQITRLDPRNAEGRAFLSAFSEAKDQTADEIEYLKKWMSSASPLDVQFYGRIMGSDAALTPEKASIKLGRAFLKTGKKAEAVETLSVLLVIDPENGEAIDLLTEAVDSADQNTASAALESLQQAVYANPGNVSLVDTLVRLENKSGHFDDAIKLLKEHPRKFLRKTNGRPLRCGFRWVTCSWKKTGTRKRRMNSRRPSSCGVSAMTPPIPDDQRSFAMQVFEKSIHTYKLAYRPRDVKAVLFIRGPIWQKTICLPIDNWSRFIEAWERRLRPSRS